MKIKIGSLLLSVVILASCSDSSKEEAGFLEGRTVKLSEDFNIMTLLWVNNDTFIGWSYDYQRTPIIWGERESDTIIYRGDLCHIGQGPGEFIRSSIGNPSGDLVTVMGPSSGHELMVIKKSMNSDSINETYYIANLSNMRIVNRRFLNLSDSTLLFLGAPYDQCRSIFGIIDYRNGKYYPAKFWPDDGYDGPDIPKHSIYTNNGKIFGNGRGEYVYCAGVNRYAFIFRINDDNEVEIISKLYDSPMGYKALPDGLNYGLVNPEIESLVLSATPEAIYVFVRDKDKEGKAAQDFRDSSYGDTVEVYDWSGNLKGRYNLDHYGYGIVADGKTEQLYLGCMDADSGEIELVQYDMSEI